MNKTILILLFIITFPVLAQTTTTPTNTGDPETIFSDNTQSGYYGAPELKAIQLNTYNNTKEWGLMLGARGGWIMDRTISIGAAGYGLVTSHRAIQDGATYYYYRVGMGGLFLEYIQSSNSAIHYTINGLIGAGGVSFSSPVGSVLPQSSGGSSAFFVLEPGVAAEVNLTRHFRIDAGISYRVLLGMDLSQVQNQDLQGLSINLAFKFGNF